MSEVLFRPDALPSSLYADGTYPVDLIRPFMRVLRVTRHNDVDADTERVLQLSIQELVTRSILASPTELQYVNYILEEASNERKKVADGTDINHSTFPHYTSCTPIG